MENTEHYNLNLPDGEDIYNINDFNQNTEKLDDLIYDINEDIADMKVTFRAGVDACYNACVTKGSTPDSHALSDVVQGILDIETGGSGDCYSMFPQEVPRWRFQPGGCMIGDIQFEDGTDTFVAHIVASENNSIMMNFLGYYWATTASGTLSLVIDGTTVISNIASFSFNSSDYPDTSDYDIDPSDVSYSFSYTLPTPLSAGYHTLALRPNLTTGYSVEFINALFNFYGSNFVAVQNPGHYLVNGVFSSYYTPSGFVAPTNPITYQLVTTQGGSGCSASMETIENAMNNRYSSTFDSGSSYHMCGIWGYDTEDDYIIPSLSDTFTYTNGKFVYNHSESRTFPDYYMGDIGVGEEHYFILPITGNFWRSYKYVTIHGKLSYKQGNMDYSDIIMLVALKRVSQSRVEFVDDYNCYLELGSLSEDNEFMLSFDISSMPSNGTSFLALYFSNMNSADDPYTIEIDKIWGTYYDMGDD